MTHYTPPLVDPQSYKDFSKVEKLIEILGQEISVYDYKHAIKTNSRLPKDSTDSYPSWMWFKYSFTVGECAMDANNQEKQVLQESSDAGTWLTYFLHEKNQTINYSDAIDPFFNKTKNAINDFNLDGLCHVSLHFMEPGFRITPHTDLHYENGINSMLYSFNVSKGYSVFIDNTEYKLPNKDYFCFDPHIEHYADNTDDWWIATMLRIEKDAFK